MLKTERKWKIMRLHQIKEHKPRILWVRKTWKVRLRTFGSIKMYLTKKECEYCEGCKAVKLRNFIEEEM